MIKDQLNKILTRTREQGIRAGVRYVRKQIYSTSEYYVFRNNMNKLPEIKSDKFNKFQISEISNPDCELFHKIYRLWPLETRPNREQSVIDFLRNRSETGAMCFVLLHEQNLAGAHWMSRPSQYYLHFNIPFLPGEHVSHWTFIVSKYRGIGASKFFKTNCLHIGKERGINSIISVTSVNNIPSIKMNKSTGFKIIGSIKEQHLLFKYSHSFVPANDN